MAEWTDVARRISRMELTPAEDRVIIGMLCADAPDEMEAALDAVETRRMQRAMREENAT